MSIVKTFKDRTENKTASVKEAFRNEDGAIDLASIMVGIIVIGLIGAVIAATVFAVIPWAQDNATRQQLSAIDTARDAYQATKMETDNVSDYSNPSPETLHAAGFLGDVKSYDNGVVVSSYTCTYGPSAQDFTNVYATFTTGEQFTRVAYIASWDSKPVTITDFVGSSDTQNLFLAACSGEAADGKIHS